MMVSPFRAAAVMGADLAGLTAGGVAGGAAGLGYADLGTNGITLMADLAEQNMAQVCLEPDSAAAHDTSTEANINSGLWAAQESFAG